MCWRHHTLTGDTAIAARAGLLVAVGVFAALGVAEPPAAGPRIAALNRGFLAHLDSMGADEQITATIRQRWTDGDLAERVEMNVPEALALLYPRFGQAKQAIDAGDFATAAELFSDLDTSRDAYLAANVLYLHTLALMRDGQVDAAGAVLTGGGATWLDLDARTPFAPQLHLVRSFLDARDGRYHAAVVSLREMSARYPDASDAWRGSVARLLSDIQQRGLDRLDEMAILMEGVADELARGAASPETRTRQQRIVAVLDALIARAEQQQQQPSRSESSAAAAPDTGESAANEPGAPASESAASEGADGRGSTRAAWDSTPGQAWGQLPPAERERILQSLRQRFPSRYRHLVEQYFRTLTEEEE